MKQILIAIIGIPIMVGNAYAAACITSCATINNTYTYCCVDTIEYSCPTGWTVYGTNCRRDTVTSSDTYGYYTQSYGTCTATKTTCYKGSNTQSTNSDGTACIKKSSL